MYLRGSLNENAGFLYCSELSGWFDHIGILYTVVSVLVKICKTAQIRL